MADLMKAFRLIEHGTPGRFAVETIPVPKPAACEVLVRVRACGLNRLDLWTEQGALPVPIPLPRISGCEMAGEIAVAGDDVRQWRVGDRVAVQSNLFCGECEFCARGEESLCLKSIILGVQRDGGFCEYVAVPSSALVRLPDNVGFEASAALTLAASTAMHMLTNRTKVAQGEWVLVIAGASGVGSAAIQIAKNLGTYVIATGSSETKREFARKLGADYTIDLSQDDWPAEVRKITQKRGVDVVVEHVGGDVLVKSFECLARNGRVVTCGATAGREVPLNLWPFFVKQHSLIGSYGRNRQDMICVLEWAAEGRIKATIDRTYSLDEAPKAFADLRARRILGKAVICP
jgi:2-desacetyl-2-hydroxyethyl bacteriochlorophyllide A dehydrogenase